MAAYTRLLCSRLGIRRSLLPIPEPLCRALAALLAFFQRRPLLKRDTILGLTMDADFDIEPARRELGYEPVAFERWLLERTGGDPFWER
jgi:hypothetical protein